MDAPGRRPPIAPAVALAGVVALAVAATATARAGEGRGFTGMLAIRGDQVLAEENADRLFVPASVHKLVVSVAALHHLGPEHRIVTRVRSTGPMVETAGPGGGLRELRGDLVVEAAGDPTWSDALRDGDARRPLRELALQLRAVGVARVTGDVVVDASGFPGRSIPLDWGRGDSALGYGAAPSALAIDENVVRLSMAPGRAVGDPARLTAPPDLEVVNHTVTVTDARHGKGNVDFLPVWGTATVVVRGEYPISEPPFVVRLAAPDPVERAARALVEELEAAGVEVAGGVRVVTTAPPVDRDAVLAAVSSAPLVELLPLVLADSHNWYAEMLLRQLAWEVSGEGRLDAGLELARVFLEEVVGLEPSSFVLDDGSGLSPSNLVTPRAVVELLRFGLEQPWRQVLLDSLSSGPKGTLAAWGRTPKVAAKTGTLRHTQTLAGVLSAGEPTAEPIVFAVFLNHRADQRPALKREIVRRLWEWHRLPSASAPVAASN
ncbi:MAG TPA: D-alanyl-D-alanine carboxypeptidase/D-alanyl-D-alanine-endopeptidase [Thermoanaerobaculia bacterium]|nr:D-alanyl-D-alanine carboxypeptidase/D-alanyl-D-alanine-endopeptidase [Thermoanaerobaculia bacterium]